VRRLLTAVAASTLLVALTGCGYFTDPYTDYERSGGVSPEQAEETILEIEGMTDATYGTYEWYSPGEGGLFSSSGMDVVLTVTIDPEYSVDDHDALLEFLAATAWSVNDHYPKGTVTIQLIGGEDLDYDWLPAARKQFDGLTSFWEAGSQSPYGPAEWDEGGRALSISTDTYGERFGRWPSAEVDAPPHLLAHTPVTPIVLPAITDLALTVEVGDENTCYRLTFVRNGPGAVYYGEVTTSLLSANGDELQTEVLDEDREYQWYCFEKDEFPEDASVLVSTGEYDEHEFTAVNETVELTDN
jgi:hypothetical protein